MAKVLVFRHDDQVPRGRLHPHQVWLIGVPLNLLLAIPCYYPVAYTLLMLILIPNIFRLTGR